jgi:hypothetical protein
MMCFFLFLFFSMTSSSVQAASSRCSFIRRSKVLIEASRVFPIELSLRGGGSFDLFVDKDPEGFEILSETILHDNWRKLVSRQVRFPSKLVADFEIVSQGDRGGKVSDGAVLVFVWNSATKTATLIREYMPSVHRFVPGLAAGMVEDKHRGVDNESQSEDPVQTAAVHELEEECRLQGGTWFRLCEPTIMDKYATTRLSVYLVIDPMPVDEAVSKARDATEEGMHTVEGVTVEELWDIVAKGGMTVVGGWATQMALHKLRELGEID